MNFNPHDYQDYAIRYIEKHPVAAVLLDMGLGKTVITLDAINTRQYMTCCLTASKCIVF